MGSSCLPVMNVGIKSLFGEVTTAEEEDRLFIMERTRRKIFSPTVRDPNPIYARAIRSVTC